MLLWCTCTCYRVNQGLYSYLNVKELLARNRRDIWSLNDSNGIQTHNHLDRKRTLNHLVKLAKWLCVRSRTKWLWIQISLLSLEQASWALSYVLTFNWITSDRYTFHAYSESVSFLVSIGSSYLVLYVNYLQYVEKMC